MAAFPSTLPNVRMSRYSFAPVSANIRTDMESGYARVRRRTSSAPTEIDVSWTFTIGELAIFEKFFQVDLLDGSIWFDISLVNGMGQTTYSARFKEPYHSGTSAREFMWDVSAKLEVMGRPLLP